MQNEDYGNLPREQLMRRADEVLKRNGFTADDVWSGKVEIRFKFTCEKCGERCMFEDPNKLYERGDCHACGHNQEVKEGGFAMMFKLT